MIQKNRGHYQKVLKDYTVSKTLKRRGKSNEYFENMLTRLTLEEIVALKIEISMREANTALMGLPIYRNLSKMTKCGALMAAIGLSHTFEHASSILGMEPENFLFQTKKYNILRFFDEEVIDNLKKERQQQQEKQNELDSNQNI